MKEKNIYCPKLVLNEKGELKVCNSSDVVFSGTNTWKIIRKANNGIPPIMVLKQRCQCNRCGQYHYRNLDGSLIKNEYTDDEVEKLIELTNKKIQEKDSSGGK